MKKSDAQHLLFIEPRQPPAAAPVIDAPVRQLTASLRQARPGPMYKGCHTCSCGARSSCCDLVLPNGLVTNSLALHYLAWHRDEVPETELERVRLLPQRGAGPTAKELVPPPAQKVKATRPRAKAEAVAEVVAKEEAKVAKVKARAKIAKAKATRHRAQPKKGQKDK